MPVDPTQLVIVHFPHPALRRPAQEIRDITPEVRQVAQRMLQLMHQAPGVGLAAPQVGLSWRMFVACPDGDPAHDRVFINPRLSDPSREMEDMEEGCLSIPDVRGQIRRHKRITITALDLDGQPFTLTAEGLEARIWQHEMDHLDGTLIIDRMTPLDRLANQRILRALETAVR